MSKAYRHPSGRVIMRQSNGRFRKMDLSDFGITNVNNKYKKAVCQNCGYSCVPILLELPTCCKCFSQMKWMAEAVNGNDNV